MTQSHDPTRDPNTSAAVSGEAGDASPVDPDQTRIQPAFGESLPRSSQAAAEARYTTTTTYKQVGRYQIMERIGKGAMASVYKAYDPSIDRTLAIKFLHQDLCVEEEHRIRFLREAKAAGGLSHPNIVTIYDVGEIEGRPYIAMELLDGVTLSEVMKPGVGLPSRDVAIVALQLARALDYAHSKGIFHRDIKPSNLMQLKGGNTIKVTDFGIAHVAGGDHQQTQVGTVLGTPHYMSPEQAMGEAVDGRSDLFSAGVVIYQLLTGRVPFEAASLVTLAHKIAKEQPTPISKLRGDAAPALRRIAERCLMKDPAKRFQSGDELASALSKVVQDLNEETQTAGQPRIIPLRIKWALSMGLVVALTMALTATIVIQRQYAAMMGQVIDYGASLANFLATENAEPTLLKEWVAIDVSVKDILETQSFHEITVVDRDGIVRVSNKQELVEKSYVGPSGATELARRKDGVVVTRYEAPDGNSIIEFKAPITFKRNEERVQVGSVHLGIPERPLSSVARLSMLYMVFLILVTLAAVVVATYLMADRYFKQIRLLVESMAEIRKGRYDYRIAEQRKDEFGQLYRAFDDMAEALQKRTEPEQPGKTG
ncbi:MAG TPA: protein kinase [Burkholderiales bacterium]|nr:protein kinase [Burkholderiales bacterium]